MDSGKFVGYIHWKPAVMAETGGEFLVMDVSRLVIVEVLYVIDVIIQREDLVRLLYRVATDAGATVHFNTEVVSIQSGSESAQSPSVTLADGSVLAADVIVGADGSKSIVRKAVFSKEDDVKPAGLTVYTGVVDVEKMLEDPELRQFALAEEVRI